VSSLHPPPPPHPLASLHSPHERRSQQQIQKSCSPLSARRSALLTCWCRPRSGAGQPTGGVAEASPFAGKQSPCRPLHPQKGVFALFLKVNYSLIPSFTFSF